MENNSTKSADLQRPISDRVRFSVESEARTVQCTCTSIPHRVGYNWNKGGRLKDLRLRHLARKFFTIWMQNTFGQILPYVAKCHYENMLQKRIFQGWRDEWWASRKEWSLSLRAECHHKYHLLLLTFQRWQTFISLQDEKKSKILKAKLFDNRRRMRHFWHKWENFVQMRRLKRRRNQSAREKHRRTHLRSLWRLWQIKYQQHQNICTMEDQALKLRTVNLQSRAFLQWKERHAAVCSQRENESKASLHYISSGKKKWLIQWRTVVSSRQHKKQLQAVAMHTAHLLLMRQSWEVWRIAWRRKHSEEERLKGAEQLTIRCAQRRAVLKWRAYVTGRKEKAGRDQMASQHHHQHLQRALLQVMSFNVSQNRARRLNNEVAVQHHYQTVINRYWWLWKDRLEEAEDEPFQALTDMALTNYRMTLLSRFYDHWREKLAQQRHMQELEWRADIWFAEHLLPRYLNSWIEFTLQKRLKTDRRRRADVYNMQRLCTWVLHTWQERAEKHKDEMLSQRMAILHEEQSRLQRVWARWRQRTQQRMGEEKEKRQEQKCSLVPVKQQEDAITELPDSEQQACLQGDLCCMRRALARWKKFVQRQKLKTRKLEHKQHCQENQVNKQSVVTWEVQHNMSKKTVEALWHWALTLQAKVFLAWREKTKCVVFEQHQQREALSMAQSILNQSKNQPHTEVLLQLETTGTEKAQRHHDNRLLRNALRAWNEYHHAHLKYKVQHNFSEKTQLALWHRALTLQAKVFLAWREKTKCVVFEQHQQREALSLAKSVFNQVELLQRKTTGTEKAQRHDTNVLRKALRAWIKHHHACPKYKEPRLEQMQHCQENQVAKQSFVSLEHNFSEKTVQALWHWALTLQAKVFDGWRLWVAKQRWKRLKVAEAAEVLQRKATGTEKAQRHHDTNVLRKALRVWIKHHHARPKYKEPRLEQMQHCQENNVAKQSFVSLEHNFSEKTVQALWHWALTLQAKVFDGWRLWVAEQRWKRLKVAEAAEVDKEPPQTVGVMCVPAIGDHMTDMQMLLTESVVRRCAMRWKQRALCKPKVTEGQVLAKTVTLSFSELKKDSPSEQYADNMELLSPIIRRQPRRKKELFEPPLKVLPHEVLPAAGLLGHTCLSQTYLPGLFSASLHHPSISSSAAHQSGDVQQFSPHKTSIPTEDTPPTSCDLLLPPAAFMSIEKLGHMQPNETSGEYDVMSSLMSELMSIQQDMRSFQQDRKLLSFCQNTRDILHIWLQTSGKDEEVDKNTICQQLVEIEEYIERLSSELTKQRLSMRLHAERLRHLQAALDSSGFFSLCQQVQM
ncbi:protein SFI1 homolog isoform X3 [Entelurus aequoreus]|uniref:protein SFI1 homolog isoform X3 n=1 Tax=Entelurus aequoreus TaxID=161455 RepID=UPI002B1E5298|nr:protein SFI1 homolog isoform X3 [Entelurus aequoreus]